MPEARPRLRELGFHPEKLPFVLPPGTRNDITDVAGVQVGHFTLIEGDSIRTGATAILPHPGNLFMDKVPAGIAVGNGFGKLTGSTQVAELGEIETPILLTNTLAVPRAADAILDWTLSYPGNETVKSVNPIVGETNDGYLNDIRRRALTSEMILNSIQLASSNPIVEGALGAGTGTVAFGWKGGIGSSSRCLPDEFGGYRLGALVQSNFGGILQICGIPVGKAIGSYYLKEHLKSTSSSPAPDLSGGSIMIILATDAPLDSISLNRLARRGLAGLARTGAAMGNQSGDYVIAFSTAEAVRLTPERRSKTLPKISYPNDLISPLFLAAIEAVEEAVYNSLLKATTLQGFQGRRVNALPIARVRALIKQYSRQEEA